MMKKTLLFVCALLALCLCANVYAETDTESQLALIASLPYLGVDTEIQPWNYVVTDLDRNGRLELITATLQGTGLYTYLNVWEVNEAGTALEPAELMWPEYDAAPDICVSTAVPVWEDKETGIIKLLFESFTRNGYAELYTFQDAVWYENGGMYKDILAYGSTICSDPETCEESYIDAAGNPISTDEYNNIGTTGFGTPATGTLTLNWQTLDPAVQPSVEDLRAALSLFDDSAE